MLYLCDKLLLECNFSLNLPFHLSQSVKKDVMERTAPRSAPVWMEGDATEWQENVCVSMVGQETSASQVISYTYSIVVLS